MRTISKSIILLYGFLQLISTSGCKSHNQKRLEVKQHSLSEKVGTKFQIGNLVDTAGKAMQIDFSKNDLTIVDFWFRSCPPCIEEMRQFESLLNGKEGKISIVSISVNNFRAWKATLYQPMQLFPLGVRNWEHLAVRDSEADRFGNEMAVKRILELEQDLNVKFFPSYFVVDKDGVIIERPESAVEYLKGIEE